MYSRQTACFRGFSISLKYHSEAQLSLCNPKHLLRSNPNESDTPCKLLSNGFSSFNAALCSKTHTHTSANMKMQKLPKQHKCKLYSINWHCYQISSNSHHKRHALILCSAQKWIIPPATQGKNVLVFVLNFESRLTPERKQINKSNLNMDLDCYTRLVHTKTFN